MTPPPNPPDPAGFCCGGVGTSPAYKQYVAQDTQMKAFADMSPSVEVRPSFPSVEMMFSLMDTTMANIYTKKDSIQSALQAAQDQTQRWLDADNAGKK